TEARRKHAIAEEELRKLVAESELRALRAQIDPHFFFNALNSVASLINTDAARAERLLEDLSELFRYAFRRPAQFISLEEELHLVETYINVEKVRLGDKLQFRKTIAPEVLRLSIPALTIQPLIENAIKHGIGKQRDGGSISLSVTLRPDRLSIFVADSGAGISKTDMAQLFTRGVGLSNVNSRLQSLYGQSSGLQIDSQPGQGTTVSFSIESRKETTNYPNEYERSRIQLDS